MPCRPAEWNTRPREEAIGLRPHPAHAGVIGLQHERSLVVGADPGQFTASLSPLPGLNLGWLDAPIFIGSPVRGLRPVEALRLLTE